MRLGFLIDNIQRFNRNTKEFIKENIYALGLPLFFVRYVLAVVLMIFIVMSFIKSQIMKEINL